MGREREGFRRIVEEDFIPLGEEYCPNAGNGFKLLRLRIHSANIVALVRGKSGSGFYLLCTILLKRR